MNSLRIVCPSRSRADNLLTKKLFVGFSLIVVVPNRQLQEYQEKNNESHLEIIGHPDYIKGIAGVRWWIMQNLGDVFMIDDDIDHVRNYSKDEVLFSSISNASHINEIIQSCYNTAKDLDVKMWGFADHQAPIDYKSQRPFSFSGLIPSKSCGIMSNHGLSFNQKDIWVSGVEEYYFSLLNAIVNRKAFIDNRYSFFNVKDNLGGINDYRKASDELKQDTGLYMTFGRMIKPNRKTKKKHRRYALNLRF